MSRNLNEVGSGPCRCLGRVFLAEGPKGKVCLRSLSDSEEAGMTAAH